MLTSMIRVMSVVTDTLLVLVSVAMVLDLIVEPEVAIRIISYTGL